MKLLKRSTRGQRTRLFFATDFHGSTLTFRKLLSAPGFFGAHVLVAGGDLTGKRIAPVSSDDAQASAAAENAAERDGSYVWQVTNDADLERVRLDPAAERALLDGLAADRLRTWLGRAEEVLAESGTPLFIIGGNDDSEVVVDVLRDHGGELVHFVEDKVIDIFSGCSIAGLGWSNPTPWNTPRECGEPALGDRLEATLSGRRSDQRLILNVHVPPLGVLDSCPALDTTHDPPRPLVRAGQIQMAPVGSTAIRSAISETQPLLALCGHVHEARGAARLGRTLVVNPGSEYATGTLSGALIDVTPADLQYQLVSG